MDFQVNSFLFLPQFPKSGFWFCCSVQLPSRQWQLKWMDVGLTLVLLPSGEKGLEGGNRNVFLSHVLCLLISFSYVYFREGKTNAHVKGDYQRIGDVMLRNMRTLKVAEGFG